MPPVPLGIRSIPRRAFDDALLGRLHAFANRLLAEDAAHFAVHARTNDLVHVFERRDTGALVGFQFWRTGAIDLSPTRLAPARLPLARLSPSRLSPTRTILGGKLRVDPAFRNRGLHLRSGLRFYLECRLRAPTTRFYRLSIASLFGFVSITSALADYRLLDPRARDPESAAVWAAFQRQADESHYRLDPSTGLVFVDIRPTAETLAQFSPAYFARPEAQVYLRVNPGWRDNGEYVAFWFRFTPRNLARIARTIWRKRGGAGSARRQAAA